MARLVIQNSTSNEEETRLVPLVKPASRVLEVDDIGGVLGQRAASNATGWGT